MKKLLLTLSTALLVSCCNVDGTGPSSDDSGESYYPVRVCPIGNTQDCVTYKAKSVNYLDNTKIVVRTLDGHIYDIFLHGWAITITRK